MLTKKASLQLNGFLVALILTIQSWLNRLEGDRNLGSKASKSGAALLLNYVTSSSAGKLLKGNWREQNSIKGQFLALTLFSTFAFFMDALSQISLASEGQLLFGQTTLLQLMTCLGLVSKMLAAFLLGKHTYTGGTEDKANTAHLPSSFWRVLLALSLILLLSVVNSLLNQLFSPSSSLIILCNLHFSTSFSKVVKTLMKYQHTVTAKATMILWSSLVGIGAAVLFGLCFQFESTSSSWSYSFDWLYHYFGPTTAMVVSQVTTNLIFRLKRGIVEANSVPNKSTRSNMTILLVVATVATNCAASLGYLLSSSAIISLAIKQCQAGYTYHQNRKAIQPFASLFRKVLFLLSHLCVVVLFELCLINWSDSSNKESVLFFRPSFAVFAGVCSALTAKHFRNWILPKPQQQQQQQRPLELQKQEEQEDQKDQEEQKTMAKI